MPAYFTDEPAASEGIRAKAVEQLRFSFTLLEDRLTDREWLFERWTILDGYMLWLWFRAVGSGLSPEEFPNVHDAATRCQERPSVARVLDLEERVFDELEREGKMPPLAPCQVGRIPGAAGAH